MIELRDGSVSVDSRLGALEEFDDRSLAYSITDTLKERYEKLVPINKVHLAPTCLDQGQEGACAGFATTHAILTEPRIQDPKIYNAKFARESLYYPAQMNDEFPGGEYPGADPRMGGTSVLAVMKEAKALGVIEKYEWAFSIESLVLGVSWHGPAVLGTVWTDSMMRPDRKGAVKTDGRVVGRHAYLMYGVNIRTRMALCLNSWGEEGYGVQGRFQIALDDVEDLLGSRGEAVFITKTKKEA